MRIALGSDHAAYDMRLVIADHLRAGGYDVDDLGCPTPERTDYPVYGEKVARAVVEGRADLGIAICGSGIGISIAANKVPGARAACVSEAYSAQMSRRHNNANVLCFGARVVGEDVATMLVDAFLAGEFEGGRHAGRIELLDKIC